VIVFTHPDCLRHDPGRGHPESPVRLQTLLARLAQDGRFQVTRAEVAPRDPILLVHPATYLTHLEESARGGGGRLDQDTVINAASWDAALGAVGAVLAAVASAHGGRDAFAAIRPPGHHALAERAMGFCLLSNVVIGARHAQSLGRRRILIVDWDVHHGNGTQTLVERDPSIRYVSLHQWPAYPGTGSAGERGVDNVFNIPMPPGLPRERYVEALWSGIHDAGSRWEPDLIVISAGFDAMAGDPLGGFTLEPEDYAKLSLRIRQEFPSIPVVSVMEGGYHPERLADGVMAHLAAFIPLPFAPPSGYTDSPALPRSE